MDTSKTSSIKSLLLRAWRERWSDLQWGINIKQVLPRGVSGDVYNLADCILQQALIGYGPNRLVLSYLKHCLSSQLVSYGAILQSVSKYQDFHKPYCIISLLEFLKSFHKRISCFGNAEECLTLCVSMISCVLWLYSCILQSLQKLAELKQSPEHSSIVEKSCEMLKYFLDSTFLKSLLYVGKHEDNVSYNQIMQKRQEIEMQLSQMQGSQVSKDVIENAIKIATSLDSVANFISPSLKPRTLIPSLNGVLTLESILNPTSDIQALVEQLVLLQKLQNLSWPLLYCEMVRGCFMGLIDCPTGTEELKWSSFTFLKIPQIITKLHAASGGNPSEPSADLDSSLDMLLNYIPLLDLADTKCNCDCIQFLLNELQKTGLLLEPQYKKLMQRRQNESHKLMNRSVEQQNKAQPGSPDLILRAEPTVVSILKTLDADYTKNQDALLGVLCHMLSGKSLELILAAAAATGKLHSFAVKLIKFNEFSKQIGGEGSKAYQTRALLFDITFLMLCHIAQQYGAEVVTSGGEIRDSFFEHWVNECFSEGGKYKSPDLMLQRADTAKMDVLLSQFSSGDGDLKTSLVKWHEVCINAPAAIKEVLLAWENGCVSTDNVKVILDNVKSHMCCLPVCVSAWLCSYINIVHSDHRLKPLSMLQEFQKPLALLEGTTSTGSSSTDTVTGQANPDGTGGNQYYKERSGLMITIIKKMFYDVHPPMAGQAKMKSVPLPHALVSRAPINEILHDILASVHLRGWLDLKATYTFENLLCIGGPQWFVNTLVKKGLDFVHRTELQQSVDILFAIFQIDIEQCTLSLLVHCLPGLLQSEKRSSLLIEPRGSSLARFVAMCMFSALQSRHGAKGVKKRSNKRTRRDVEMEEMAHSIDFKRPPRSRCLVSGADIDDDIIGTTPGLNLQDPLHKAIAELFRLFSVLASDPVLSQRTQFVIFFLQQVVACGKQHAKNVLQFMPASLVPKLLKCLPEMFTIELLLGLCDTNTVFGRRLTAKVLVQLQNSKSHN